jgi:hypothetical protein
VKALMRGFGLATMMVLALGFFGCGADNESEADKAQKGLGAPPTPEVKSNAAAEKTGPPATYGERKGPTGVSAEYKKAMGGRR